MSCLVTKILSIRNMHLSEVPTHEVDHNANVVWDMCETHDLLQIGEIK